MTHDSALVLYANGAIAGRAGRTADSLVVDGNQIVAVGARSELIERFAGAREVDLGGRLLVAGLVDGHIHAIRGGATWNTEMHWERLNDRHDALEQIAQRTRDLPVGSWISAIGGWHHSQFGGWLPQPDDLDRIAPHHPVYVQSLYDVGVANRRAIELLGRAAASAGFARDPDGRPTGYVRGLPAFSAFVAAVGVPTLEQEIAGTRSLFSELASWGVTGISDPGGFGMSPDRYGAFQAIPSEELDVRVRTFASVVSPGAETAEAAEHIRAASAAAYADLARAVGLGEIVHFGCHDFEGLTEVDLTADTARELEQISTIAAEAGIPIHIHAITDPVIDLVLTAWESVGRRFDIAALRFSIAHADRISGRNIRRLANLGGGIVLDGRQALRGSASAEAWGSEVMGAVPPIGDLVRAGIRLGLGTDGTRASSSNPWLALSWLTNGRSLDGVVQRAASHLSDRSDALRVMTEGNSWFTGDDHQLGRIAPGYLADFAVIDRDYRAIAADDIPNVTSELTVMNGRVTHSTGSIG